MPDNRSHIVLGIVCNARKDKTLIARRPPGTHLGGLWEFPGGKVRAGESALQALKRELHEELNITVRDYSPLISFDYDYPDKSLRFQVWEIPDWSGKPTGREGQETRWVETASLSAQDFPAANKGIINACKLPGVYLITPDLDSYPAAFMDELRAHLTNGVKLAQFRSRTSDRHKGAITEMVTLCRDRGAVLLVNSTPEFAMEVGAAGVHLSSKRLLQLTRRPLGADSWVAASCHNPRELQHAVEVGIDFCVLSQVRQSPGKRGAPLGWERFSDMVRQMPIPVYALGGMQFSDLGKARRQGAQGIALISGAWNMKDWQGD